MPRILVTNDDGIFTDGIASLAAAMEELGEVVVCAPDREMSAISHAFTIMRHIRVKEVKENWFAVGGTPADCAYVGLHKLAGGPVDLVVSGINRGVNLAKDVHYSGTVAGAMEGYFHGTSGIAISQMASDYSNLDRDAEIAKRIARYVLSLDQRVMFSVNIPIEEPVGMRFCKLGQRYYEDVLHEDTDTAGNRVFWIEGTATNETEDKKTDTYAIEQGYVTITPLNADLTDYEHLHTLNADDI